MDQSSQSKLVRPRKKWVVTVHGDGHEMVLEQETMMRDGLRKKMKCHMDKMIQLKCLVSPTATCETAHFRGGSCALDPTLALPSFGLQTAGGAANSCSQIKHGQSWLKPFSLELSVFVDAGLGVWFVVLCCCRDPGDCLSLVCCCRDPGDCLSPVLVWSLPLLLSKDFQSGMVRDGFQTKRRAS